MKKSNGLRLAHSVRRRRGATLVEFGLVVPVMFLFIFGLIEFGRIVMVKQSVTNAAREGCRTAVLATTTSENDVDTAVRNHLQSVISNSTDPTKLRVDITPDSLAGITSGTSIDVEVAVNYTEISWLPGNFMGLLGNPIISARATQERE